MSTIFGNPGEELPRSLDEAIVDLLAESPAPWLTSRHIARCLHMPAADVRKALDGLARDGMVIDYWDPVNECYYYDIG